MQSVIEHLVAPYSWNEFKKQFLYRCPYASPGVAWQYRHLITWKSLWEITAAGHQDTWLAREGLLPADKNLCTGQLHLAQLAAGYEDGYTILIRHAERSHPVFEAISTDFHRHFGDPIDIQIYATPAAREGFAWHYDEEDVFVIQTSGEKEFSLFKNSVATLEKFHPHMLKNFSERVTGPEIRCFLKAGDFLYIPAGYWHKAKALTPSVHMSVGVMASQRLKNYPSELVS